MSMFFIYDLLVTTVLLTAILPWHLFLVLTKRFTREGLQQRLGTNHVPSKEKTLRVLIHAVSVGEVTAAEPLMREILQTRSDVEFIVTIGNNDGMSAARRLQRLYPAMIHTQFLPWDERKMLSSWLRKVNPDMVLILETELWPNLIRECGLQNVPLCIVNGRVYPRDVFGYRMAHQFFRRVLSYVGWIGVQSEEERERFLAIGASPSQIDVMGNVKCDVSLPPPSSSDETAERLKDVPLLLVAGSTHSPEEKWLLESFLTLRVAFPELRLVLAPRHIHRGDSLERLVHQFGLHAAGWSRFRSAENKWDVLILDQVGFLSAVYGHADVVVIGGSFVDRGGHNLLEAAAQKRAIIIGPHVQHFQDIVKQFDHAHGVIRLKSRHDLTSTLQSLLGDPARRTEMGERAYMSLDSQRGVAEKYANTLVNRLATVQHQSSSPP
jgi:3-deoxy-D-manno-octulosonic-acid transferase